MEYVYTDGSNVGFIKLCHGLDDFLNEIVGGEENRAEYIPYNTLYNIHNVIVAYDNDIFRLVVLLLKSMMRNVPK